MRVGEDSEDEVENDAPVGGQGPEVEREADREPHREAELKAAAFLPVEDTEQRVHHADEEERRAQDDWNRKQCIVREREREREGGGGGGQDSPSMMT